VLPSLAVTIGTYVIVEMRQRGNWAMRP